MATIPLLGEFITRNLPDNTIIPRGQLLAALTAAGLPTSYAGELSLSAALSRVVKDLAGKQLIHKVPGDAKLEKRFQLDATAFNAGTNRVEVNYHAHVSLCKVTGNITSDDPIVQAEARRLIGAALENRKTADIGRLFRALVIGEAKGFSKNASTVSFFVANTHRHVVDRLESFIAAIGGKLERIPVVDFVAVGKMLATPAPVATPAGTPVISVPVVSSPTPGSTGCGVPVVVDIVKDSLMDDLYDIEAIVKTIHAGTREATILKACERILEIEEYAKSDAVRALIGSRVEIVIDYAAYARKTLRDAFDAAKAEPKPEVVEPTPTFEAAPRTIRLDVSDTAPSIRPEVAYDSGLRFCPPVSPMTI